MDPINPTNNWSDGITLTKAELWFVDYGTVRLDTAAAPHSAGGMRLSGNSGYEFPAGVTVRHRKIGPGDASICRVAIEP